MPRVRTLVGCFALCALLGCSRASDGNEIPSGLGGRSVGGGAGAAAVGHTFGGSGGDTGLVLPGEGGQAGNGCEREVSLKPVTLGAPEPFDLIIVADHSQSLAWSRDALADGLRDLLTHVEGRSVRVFLLSPTQYGATSALARNPLTGEPVVAWQDPETHEAYAPTATTYSQTCTDEEGASIECPEPGERIPYRVEGRWSFLEPEPVAVISPGQSPTEFEMQQEALVDALVGLVGTGSPEEQPLCTLSRYVSQDAAKLSRNAVFLVITDEDDTSVPDDCLTSYSGELSTYFVESGSSPCSAGCDAYRFGMNGVHRWQRHAFTCTAYSDTGTPIPGTEKASWYNLARVESCSEVSVGPCTEQERAAVQEHCDEGLRVSRCERECAEREQRCQIDLERGDVDACSQSFTYNGRTWTNLAELCSGQISDAGPCTGAGVNIVRESRYVGSTSYTSLMEGSTTGAIAAYFRATADAAFANGHYLVQGIVLDPAFSCELGAGQSYATNIAELIGSRGRLFPLCESYAPALVGVFGFAQSLVQTDFALSLESDEHVTAVTVIGGDGESRTLDADEYRFDAATRLLHLDQTVIRGTDVDLRVEVTSDCRPILH